MYRGFVRRGAVSYERVSRRASDTLRYEALAPGVLEMIRPAMDPPDHILLVDDDRQLLGLLASYLESSGYRVSTARDGRAVRAALEMGRIDLIVLDLMLPGEDGLSLCRDLRG